ncbi:MAG: holo-ACP synthase [Rhabdochlamydiaceae bacterium]|nr:holo-ACP synthase [Candidatus Amphrikana amoebophyrae]
MSNILGIGNDIIEVARITESIEKFGDKFLDKLFSKKEQEYCKKHRKSELRVAGRFAAKEAIAKALGTGFGEELSWLDIEIINNEKGKPEVIFSSSLDSKLNKTSLQVSISHCNSYAAAVAIWSKES